jgi:hypothetical protein
VEEAVTALGYSTELATHLFRECWLIGTGSDVKSSPVATPGLRQRNMIHETHCPALVSLFHEREENESAGPKRSLKRAWNSTDGANPFLASCLNGCNSLRRKLEHGCFLTHQ